MKKILVALIVITLVSCKDSNTVQFGAVKPVEKDSVSIVTNGDSNTVIVGNGNVVYKGDTTITNVSKDSVYVIKMKQIK